MDAPPRPGPDAFGADATEPDAAPSLDTAQDDAASFDAPPDTALDAGPRDVLHGYAQKGPFVAGSRVSIIALDSELFPTGVTYMTETVGALGEYEMRTLPPGFYQVEVTGEVTRDFDFSRTGTERTLRAIVQTHVRGAFDASVTLITHLTTPRIRVLVRGGVELEAARAGGARALHGPRRPHAAGLRPRRRGYGSRRDER